MPREAIYSVTLDMPREKAWQIMQDFSQPHKYVPGLINCEMHTEQRTDVGASRRVFKKTMAMDETVTEWNEGYGFKIRLHDGPKDKPFPDSYFIYSLNNADDGKTTFTATMGYCFPFGAIGDFVDRFLIFPNVKGQIRDVALAVKHYYETGMSPTPADIKHMRESA